MVKLTLSQAKRLARVADGPFSCDISARDCEAPFYGLSTVAVLFGSTYIMGPADWDEPARRMTRVR